MKRENAKEMPKTYFARHMTPGVCGYNDGNVLVDLPTIMKMAASFAGKPVYVGHQPVDVSTIEEDADGYVFDCFYNELDGWFWSRISVHSDKGHKAVRDGWAVSNAYIPTEYGEAGQHLNVDYAQKVLNGEFTHLAIVDNPRYEQAAIFTPEAFKAYQDEKRNDKLRTLQNSKEKDEPKGIMSMFKFTRKEVTEKEITNSADLVDTDIAMIDGKEVTFKEFKERINAKKNSDDEEAEAKKKAAEAAENAKGKKNDDGTEMVNDSDKMMIDGEEVCVGDLKNAYKNMKAKKNEADEAAEKEKKEKEAKENAKSFIELRNANNSKEPVRVVEVQNDKLARGALLF